MDFLALVDSAILDDRGGGTGGVNVTALAAIRFVLRRDGRLAGGRVHDCALLEETDAATESESLSFLVMGSEGFPTQAS